MSNNFKKRFVYLKNFKYIFVYNQNIGFNMKVTKVNFKKMII